MEDNARVIIIGGVSALVVVGSTIFFLYWKKKLKQTPIKQYKFSTNMEVVNKYLYKYATTANHHRELESFMRELKEATKDKFESEYLRVFNTPGHMNFVTLAARLGNLDSLKVLLKYNLDIESRDANEETPLHLSARNGKYDCVQYLLDLKANPNAVNKDGWTPLHWSCANGRFYGTKLLINYGANHRIKTINLDRLPIHFAAQNGHSQDLELLLSLDHNGINEADINGNTPILACARNGSVVCLNMLLKKGASIYDKNNDGISLVRRATVRGFSEFVMLLLDIDPKYCLLELTDIICGTGADDSISDESKQKSIKVVLTTIVNNGKYIESLVRMLSDKLQLSGIKFLDFDSSIDKAIMENTIKEIKSNCFYLISFMHFIDQSNRNVSQYLLPDIESNLVKLWIALEDLLEASSKLTNPEISLNSNYINKNNNNNNNETEIENCDVWIQKAAIIIEVYYRISKSIAKLQNISPKENLNNINSIIVDAPDNILQVTTNFQSFTTKYAKLFQSFISKNPTLLLSFEFILENAAQEEWCRSLSRLLSFELQRGWLVQKLNEIKANHENENVTIDVPRDQLLDQSCQSLLLIPNIFKGNFNVSFSGEPGQGIGVRREWFSLITKELFNADNGLFITCNDGTVQPNATSSINPDHLPYFKLAGRVIGLSIYHEEVLDVHFTRPFYKHILGLPISYTDIEFIDPAYYKNLKWILDNDAEDLNLTFSFESNDFDAVSTIDLIANGRNIPVTNSNKLEYINLVANLKMTKSIEQQLICFLEGFYDIIPRYLIALFNEYQLELLIAGLPNIDVNDWEKNTKLSSYSPSDPQIVWFWQLVNEMSTEQRAKLLQYATGSSRVPLSGFAKLRSTSGGDGQFCIVKGGSSDSLPTSSTCFNLLKLPEYKSYDQLKEKILAAISFGDKGFDFV